MKIWKKKHTSPYDEVIKMTLEEMKEYGPGDQNEWNLYLKNLKKLETMRASYVTPKRKISPDTALMVGGNLAGILLIVAYENRHILSAKAMGMLPKLPNIGRN